MSPEAYSRGNPNTLALLLALAALALLASAVGYYVGETRQTADTHPLPVSSLYDLALDHQAAGELDDAAELLRAGSLTGGRSGGRAEPGLPSWGAGRPRRAAGPPRARRACPAQPARCWRPMAAAG